MINVTESAEPVVNIWDYVENLVKEEVIDNYVYQNKLVELVYRNDTSTFDHILLPTPDKNVFITLVVDLTKESILGHVKLDLNEKYGLAR